MTPHRHILVVDRDETWRLVLGDQLACRMDASVTEAGSIAEALAASAGGTRFDAVILDTRLPDGDGRELCQRLRRAGCNIPVLIVTEPARESDVVRGLDAGANDYIAKPCGIAELLARLRAQLRAFETSEHAEIVIGPYLFRPGSKQLHDPQRNRPIRLTEKESAVLKYLYRAQGAPVRREALLHDVWGYSPGVSTHTVETHIYRLRRKLEPTPLGEPLLVNDGQGYRLRLPRPRTARVPRLSEVELALAS